MDEAEPRFAEGIVQLWQPGMAQVADLRKSLQYALEHVDVLCTGVRRLLNEGGVGRQVRVGVEMLLQLGDGVAGSVP